MAQQHTVYFGTYCGALSKGIYRSILDGKSGHLSPPELVAEASNPSFLAFSPDGHYLYAALEADGGAIGAWSVGDNGQLKALNQQPSGGVGACHVWVDATGRTVLVANYGDGSIACFPIRDDGSLDACSAFIRHTGSGPDSRRQAGPHAHSIYTDTNNKYAYVCDLGTDEVKVYRFNAALGTLAPNEPPSTKVPPRAGPRHFAMHPAGFAYVNNEMGLSVTVFRRNVATGALTVIETVPTLPQGATTENASTAEMFIEPTGRCLYVSNRGSDTITVFRIGVDGTLTPVQHVPTPAEPRGFGISGDGRWLIVGGQNDNNVAVFMIDPATGQLLVKEQSKEQTVQVGSPVCVLFAPQ